MLENQWLGTWSADLGPLGMVPDERSEVPAPGLLEPFLHRIWISVRGGGGYKGLGSCAFDLGCGIGGGVGLLKSICPYVSSHCRTWSRYT